MLLDAYTESPATWRAFAAIKSANDFKDQTGIRPSNMGDLSEVAKGGELKHGSIDEATYKYSVDTFGKMLSIDRRDIINDDLGLFEDTAMSLGRAAMRAVSDLVYKTRLSDAEYLRTVTEINESVRTRTGDELPLQLQGRPVAQAFYGVAREVFSRYADESIDPVQVGADAGVRIDEIINDRLIVNWINNADVQKQMETAIEDFLFELKAEHGFELTFEDIDSILEQCLDIARERYKS